MPIGVQTPRRFKIDALLRKWEELLAQIQGLQSAVFHIDQALSLIGYGKGRVARRFANGELIRLTGEAERAGNKRQLGSRISSWLLRGWIRRTRSSSPDHLQREGSP